MSNFEERFRNWQEKMSQKSERERHNYALTVSLLVTGIVFFFVASNWYFQISGNNFDSSFFTDIESMWNNSSANFKQSVNELDQEKNQILQSTATETPPQTSQ